MKVFEKIKSMDIDEFAECLERYIDYNDSHWYQWYDAKYCSKCDPIIKDGVEYSYCELNDKCRRLPDLDDIPDCKDLIKLWLESECEISNERNGSYL